jgi:hypothetical protein
VASDQVVVGWRGNPLKPRPVGNQTLHSSGFAGEKWRESFVDDNEMACEDLASGGFEWRQQAGRDRQRPSTHNVKIYLNETPK